MGSTQSSEAKLYQENAKLSARNSELEAELERLRQTLFQGPKMAHHLTLVVSNAEISRDFYLKVFNCKLLKRPILRGTHGYWLSLSNIQLHLVQAEKVVQFAPKAQDLLIGRVNHLSILCTDIRIAEMRLSNQGIEFVRVDHKTEDGRDFIQL